MSDWLPSWPTREEYDHAVMSWRQTMRDPDLVSGELATVMGTDPRRFGGAGLYVTVYRIGDWAVRCFCSDLGAACDPPADIVDRYQVIARFVADRQAAIPALLPVEVIDQGVFVAGAWRPVVKAPWVPDALRLGAFVAEHRGNARLLAALADAWRRLVRDLEDAPMAHGDLDLTNVLVCEEAGCPSLRLIDYDDMWIPALDGRTQTECGHEPFQHPAFFRPVPHPDPTNRPYGPRMDRFSALVTYVSLLALSLDPRLYADLGASEEDRLLFSRADYEQPTLETSALALVRKRCGPALAPYLDELLACLAECRMPQSLEAIARDAPPPEALPRTQPVARSTSALLPPLPPPLAIPVGRRVPLAARPLGGAFEPPATRVSSAPQPAAPHPTPIYSAPSANGAASGKPPTRGVARNSAPAAARASKPAPQSERGSLGVWLVLVVVGVAILLLATGMIHV